MPAGWKVRCVRADGGFFAEELLKFLEEHSLAYVIVARLTKNIKAKVAGISTWTLIDEDYAVGDLMAQLSGWKRERRFFVVGECIRENKGAIGR